MQTTIINAKTGRVTVRNLTEDELAQRKLDQSADAQRKADEAKARAAADKATAAARGHALGLGFTNAMIDVMYPQLAEASSE